MDPGMIEKFGTTYKPGEIIFCEYEPGNEFYLLQEGRVKVTKIVSDMEKALDIFQPGDIFGEMAILEDQPDSLIAANNLAYYYAQHEPTKENLDKADSLLAEVLIFLFSLIPNSFSVSEIFL